MRPDGVDEIPLAHLRAALDVPLLRELVELRTGAILEGVAGLTVPGAALRGLPAEVSPGGRIEVRQPGVAGLCTHLRHTGEFHRLELSHSRVELRPSKPVKK